MKTSVSAMRKMMGLTLVPLMFLLASCGVKTPVTMTEEEISLIKEAPDVMRILSVEVEEDLSVLRSQSSDFSLADLKTPEYAILTEKMVRTLENADGGVGLAAPQIGLGRRVVAVMRVDKEGEPIEVYPNIRIEEFRGEMKPGPEGCLSVPDQSGDVQRYYDITISYTDIDSENDEQPALVREDISGFAAVIFQHEADHLDGVIFTDKITSNQ